MRPHPRPFSCMTSHLSLHFNAAQVHFTTFWAAVPECALFANMAIFTLVSFFKAHRDEIQRKFDALRDSCAVRKTHSLFIWTSSHPHQFHQCGNIICDERERDWWMDGWTDRERGQGWVLSEEEKCVFVFLRCLWSVFHYYRAQRISALLSLLTHTKAVSARSDSTRAIFSSRSIRPRVYYMRTKMYVFERNEMQMSNKMIIR